MHRLLIVDDEHHIVDWLYDLFLEQSGLDIDIYKAYSGLEALSLQNSMRIDIVLSDIRMPKMNGIELMEQILRDWPKCKIIFLTGYNDFEYVYEAIKHPGVSYLLKTEDDDVIVGSVVKAIEKIEEEGEIANLAEQQSNLIVLLQQREIVLKLVRGDLNPGEIDQSQLDSALVPLDLRRPIIMMLGRIDNYSESMQRNNYYDLINKINLIMTQYLSYEVKLAQTDYKHSFFIWLLQPNKNMDEQETDRSLKLIKETMEPIQANCEKSFGVTLSFVVGNRLIHWDEIESEYIRQEAAVDLYMGNGATIILSQENGQESSDKEAKTVPSVEKAQSSLHEKSQLELLESCLIHGEVQEFYNILEETTVRLRSFKSKNSMAAIELYYSVALELLSYINRSRFAQEISFKVGLHKLMDVNEFISWIEAADYLFTVSKSIFELRQFEKDARNTDLISKIRQYVEKHLDGDLSLVKLAEQVNYNPSYLSRIFKQTTGINLYSYINKARLEKAKEQLLKQIGTNIHEVAKSTGFDSSQYFATVFKKTFGITPQEYRNLYLNGN